MIQEGLARHKHLDFISNVPNITSAFRKWCMQASDRKHEEEKQAKEQARQITPEEFFAAAYEYDPLGTNTPFRDTKLVKLLVTGGLKPIPLGKVYGNTPIWLIPRSDALPISPISLKGFTSYAPADTDSGAIRYPDGYPSEAQYAGDSHSQLDGESGDPDILRRIWPLGYLAYQRGAGGQAWEVAWECTGHVMVMDMERGRDHHPWIILASEWPDLIGEGTNGDGMCYAPRHVKRDAEDVHGVFPGDSRRTIIAKIEPLEGEPVANLPFLKQFGPNLNLDLKRKGGRNRFMISEKYEQYHPDLVHVMGWYWDDETDEEVCYAENGQECMRYKPATCRFLDLAPVSVLG